MTTDYELYTKITLPTALKQEAPDFMEFLQHKARTKRKLKEDKLGITKGLIKMSGDFDEPKTLKTIGNTLFAGYACINNSVLKAVSDCLKKAGMKKLCV